MRRGLTLAAALAALAACKVDVEGAPCAAAGATADCPSGQACGNDGKCSTQAATCAARCTPGATRCTGSGSTSAAETCTDGDPVCGTWVADDCAARQLVCGTRSQGQRAACECPPGFAGPAFAADPAAGSPAGSSPFPTGAASPPECRYRSLASAVAAAGALGTPATVQSYGTGEVVFGAATSDGGALTIPANVTVVAAAGATATVLRPDASAGTAAVTVQGALQGFDVQGTGAGIAVALSCGASGVPTLTDVAVDGGGTLTTGVDVSGACGATLTRVTVANVSGTALGVHADQPGQVNVYGGSVRSSGVGVSVTGGNVNLGDPADSSPLEISGNAGEGVVLQAGKPVHIALYGARIHDNDGTGVVVDLVTAGSTVAVRNCVISANGSTAGRKYGGGTPQRTAGGVLLVEGALPFTFSGNQLYKNAGDQLAFDSSDQGWSIAASQCGAATNVFACVPASGLAVAVNGGKVDATNAEWPGTPVSAYAGSGVTFLPYCNNTGPGFPAVPTCP